MVEENMKYTPIIMAVSLLVAGCGRDGKLTKKIPGVWKRDGTSTGGTDTFTSTMTISPDGTFSYFRAWNEKPLTNTFAGTWQIRGGIMFMTLTNRSGPNPNIPAGVTPMQARIIRLDDHQLVEEMDGITNISSR
jgi:hypothetical protein